MFSLLYFSQSHTHRGKVIFSFELLINQILLISSFNHKTGAEDVHLTSLVSQGESDQNVDGDLTNDESENLMTDIASSQNSLARNGSSSGSDLEGSSISEDDPTVLEMVMVKDVKAGNEVSTFSLLTLFFIFMLLLLDTFDIEISPSTFHYIHIL